MFRNALGRSHRLGAAPVIKPALKSISFQVDNGSCDAVPRPLAPAGTVSPHRGEKTDVASDFANCRRRRTDAQPDFGSPSLISTEKDPSLMAFSFSATLAFTASGTLPSKVPSGASEQPPFFMKE